MKRAVSDFQVGDYVTCRNDAADLPLVINITNFCGGDLIGPGINRLKQYLNDEDLWAASNFNIVDFSTRDEIAHLDQCIAAGEYVEFKKHENPVMLHKNDVYFVSWEVSEETCIICPTRDITDFSLAQKGIESVDWWGGHSVDPEFYHGDDTFAFGKDYIITPATKAHKQEFYKAKFKLSVDNYYKYVHTDRSGAVAAEVYFKFLTTKLDFSDRIGVSCKEVLFPTGTTGDVCFHFYDGGRTIQEVTESEYYGCKALEVSKPPVRVLHKGCIYSINQYIVCLDETSYDETEQTKGFYCIMSSTGLVRDFSRCSTQVISLASKEQIAKYEELLAKKNPLSTVALQPRTEILVSRLVEGNMYLSVYNQDTEYIIKFRPDNKSAFIVKDSLFASRTEGYIMLEEQKFYEATRDEVEQFYAANYLPTLEDTKVQTAAEWAKEHSDQYQKLIIDREMMIKTDEEWYKAQERFKLQKESHPVKKKRSTRTFKVFTNKNK